jgi:hypothetical protein
LKQILRFAKDDRKNGKSKNNGNDTSRSPSGMTTKNTTAIQEQRRILHCVQDDKCLGCRRELKVLVNADEEAGDVVVAAGFVGCLDKAVAVLFEGKAGRGGGVEEGFDFGVGQLGGEAVGAEEKEVAGLGVDFNDVGSD